MRCSGRADAYCDALPGLSCSLEAIRKADIRGDGLRVVGYRVKKTPRPKAGQIECNDNVLRGSPPNLEISLSTEITGMARIAWINQGVASKGINPIVR